MATTDELLEESEESSDSTEYITVDVDTRLLTVPSSESVFGVYTDSGVERKYFMCPRYVASENIDLLGSTVKIAYISSGGNTDTYVCDDVSAYGDDYITFSWLLKSSVFDGNTDTTISFAVKASDGTNTFNSRIGTGTTYKTIATTTLYTTYPELLLQMISMIDDTIDPTSDDAIIAGIQEILDAAAAATGSSEADISGQVDALIEGYGRGETVTVVDLTAVEVYVGDYADSDTLSVDSGAVNVYGRYITT